jgi:hypothetical protein
MDPIVARVVARHKLAVVHPPPMEERIEGIPGWDRSNFLRSLHDQASRGRTLSPNQIAAIEKIEKERGGRPAEPAKLPANVIEFGRKWYNPREKEDIVNAIRKEDVAHVKDYQKMLLKPEIQKAILRELIIDFQGGAEQHYEMNADEDDNTRREYNSMMADRYNNAATEMVHAKVQLSPGPQGTTVVTTAPKYHEILRKNRLI